MNKHAFAAALCVAAVLFSTHAARAEDSAVSARVRLHAGFGLGLLGKQEAEATSGEDAGTEFPAEDLLTTWGFFAGLEVPLHAYFTLGAELGYAKWTTNRREHPAMDGFEAKAGRFGQIDALLRPKLRFAVLDSLELHVVPIGGFTYYLPPDDSGTTYDLDFDAHGGPGFAVGGAAGMSFFASEHVGFTTEVGYLRRYFSGSFDMAIAGEKQHFARDYQMGQLQLRVGLAYAF
jgi:hypothetical protein